MNSEILSAVRNLAQSEGATASGLSMKRWPICEKRKQGKHRVNVMVTYQASHEKFGLLYKKLAE